MINRHRVSRGTNLLTHFLALDDEALGRVCAQCNNTEWPDDFPEHYKPVWWDRHDIFGLWERKHGYLLHFYELTNALLTEKQREDAYKAHRAKEQDKKVNYERTLR